MLLTAGHRIQATLVGGALVLLCGAFGLLAGGFVGGRLLPLDDSGYDHIAHAIGGASAGVMIGLVGGLILTLALPWRRRFAVLAVAVLVVAVLAALLSIAPPTG